MLTLKNTEDRLYAGFAVVWLLLSAVFIFEVPRFVFWAPVIQFALFVVYCLYAKKTVRLTAGAAVLFIFGIVYVFCTYDPNVSIYYQWYILLHSSFMFVMGVQFFGDGEDVKKRTELFYRCMLVLSLLFVAYVAVTYIAYLRAPQLAPEERKYWSVWYVGNKDVIKTATGFCASMMFAVAWGAYSVFFAKKKADRILGALLVALCFAFNVATKTRLLVFVTPALLAAEFFLWLVFCKKKVKIGVIVVSVCAALFAGLLIYYHFNKTFLKEKFADSVLFRFVDLGLRSTRWKYNGNVLSDFSVTYKGGHKHTGVPHNYWLYIYEYGGFIPFVLYAVFTLLAVVDYVRVVINKALSAELKIFLTTLLGVVALEFMVEDLFIALPSFVMVAHFIIGVCVGLAWRKDKKPPETAE